MGSHHSHTVNEQVVEHKTYNTNIKVGPNGKYQVVDVTRGTLRSAPSPTPSKATTAFADGGWHCARSNSMHVGQFFSSSTASPLLALSSTCVVTGCDNRPFCFNVCVVFFSSAGLRPPTGSSTKVVGGRGAFGRALLPGKARIKKVASSVIKRYLEEGKSKAAARLRGALQQASLLGGGTVQLQTKGANIRRIRVSPHADARPDQSENAGRPPPTLKTMMGSALSAVRQKGGQYLKGLAEREAKRAIQSIKQTAQRKGAGMISRLASNVLGGVDRGRVDRRSHKKGLRRRKTKGFLQGR